MSRHDTRATEQVAHEAALFIAREADTTSLITVTKAIPVAHGDRMTVFVSVFPTEASRGAIAFLERHRQDFSDHLKEHTKLRPLPRVDFMLDDGSTAVPPKAADEISPKA